MRGRAGDRAVRGVAAARAAAVLGRASPAVILSVLLLAACTSSTNGAGTAASVAPSTDRFLLYAELGSDGKPTGWRAMAVLSSSGATRPVPVPTGGGVATIYPRVIGAADANGDGPPEVFVKL